MTTTVITRTDVAMFIEELGDISGRYKLILTPEFFEALAERYPVKATHPETGKEMDGLALLQGISVRIDPTIEVPWLFYPLGSYRP